jgi:hypothetical protein
MSRIRFQIKSLCLLALSVFSLAASALTSSRSAENKNISWLNPYNVTWTTQSKNSSESMPCGGGDIGMNVWVENDELLFYISRSGVFDENNVFPKLGRVRISFAPDPFAGASFLQKLILKDGCVEINATKNGKKTSIRIWSDVYMPVINVDVDADEPLKMSATYENWRYEPLVWNNKGRIRASLAYRDAPMKAVVQPDSMQWQGNGVLWYHKNRENTIFDATVEQQDLSSVKSTLWNPLKSLTFGGYMWCDGLTPDGITYGKYLDTDFKGFKMSAKTAHKSFHLNIALATKQAESLTDWKALLNTTISTYSKKANAERKRSIAWWHDFWCRSHVVINPDSAASSSSSWQIGRNYQLYRYQQACNAYGKLPTKFNGGLFTFDPSLILPQAPFSPDHRDWGGGTHTAQNQRLVYWPMLKSGDFDMMKPQLDFYKNALVNAEARVQHYWGHDGACFTEQIEWFGLPMAASYGWHRPKLLETGIQDNAWINYYWDTSLEFCKMALDLQKYTGRDIHEYLPLIKECLIFFDKHYQYLAAKRNYTNLDGNGKLILYPGTACETYKMAYNSTNTIVALSTVIRGLLNLPDTYLTAEERQYFKGFEKRIPDITFREMNGHKVISPAVTWETINNMEIPQLYPVFPWHRYGVGLPDLEVAVNTWKYGIEHTNQRNFISWHQDAIFCADLGLTADAKRITLQKMTDSPRRFPTFWGPGHDWVPDHNWGGSGMIGVQEMLVQEVGDSIYLLPAWPKEWNVDFKLHLSRNTTVECTLKDGRIQQLNVSPATRKKDIILKNF